MDEISLEIQLQLLMDQRLPFINGRYVMQVRMKALQNLIAKNILPDDEATTKPLLEELTKQEAWIEQYDEMIADVKAQIEATKEESHKAVLALFGRPDGEAPSNGHKARAVKEKE